MNRLPNSKYRCGLQARRQGTTRVRLGDDDGAHGRSMTLRHAFRRLRVAWLYHDVDAVYRDLVATGEAYLWDYSMTASPCAVALLFRAGGDL